MADTEESAESSSFASFLAGKKRIPRESLYAYLFSSVVVDVIEFMGVSGAVDIYIAFCRGMYWYNGYKTDNMAVATWSEAVAGVVPYVDELPFATAFTLWTYAINVAETNKIASIVIESKKEEFVEAGKNIVQPGQLPQRTAGTNPELQSTANKDAGYSGTRNSSDMNGVILPERSAERVNRKEEEILPHASQMADAQQARRQTIATNVNGTSEDERASLVGEKNDRSVDFGDYRKTS